MKSKYSNLCVALIIVLFFWAKYVSAGFEITEIMYDLDGTDTNREWIEVRNTGNEPADLSKWFFFSDNSKHALTPEGDSLVPANSYAVIVQNTTNFRSDWPDYNRLIFDSSWTGLNNETGETISLKDSSLNEVSIVTFNSSMGGAGDGNSLQKVSGSWSGAVPTPGADNQSGSSSGGGSGSSVSGASTPTPTIATKPKEIEVSKMTTNIISKSTVFAGIPFRIDNHTTGYKKETLKVGILVWNFGDGNQKRTSDHTSFDYVYQYPGEYVVTLSYYYPNNQAVEATDRMIIKVVEPGVIVSSVGRGSDPYVEIANKSGAEVDLSRWVINGVTSSFSIPEGTIILPSKSIRFSSKVTGFSANNVTYVNILSNGGEIVASYPVMKVATSTSSSNYRPQSTPKPNGTPSIINLDDLGASAGNTDVSFSRSSYAWAGLLGVIVIGLVVVFSMRKRDSLNDNIDGGISANDIKILE